jgi:hypothetical protein
MEKPNLDNLPKEVQEYIEWAHGALNGASSLLVELNLISDGYAQDLIKIRTGKAGENGKNLNYIKSDKNDTIFTRVMVLFDKSDKLLNIERTTKGISNTETTVKETTVTTKTEIKEHRNPFEEASENFKKKNAAKA